MTTRTAHINLYQGKKRIRLGRRVLLKPEQPCSQQLLTCHCGLLWTQASSKLILLSPSPDIVMATPYAFGAEGVFLGTTGEQSSVLPSYTRFR
jgi:hypothetical protein